jgi:hypothetical protein
MAITSDERHRIVDEMIRAKREAYDFGNALTIPERDALDDRADLLEKQYAAGLPLYAISRCPHCEEPFEIAADFYGLNGPFWPEFGIQRIGNACPHVIAYLGALNYHDTVPTADECGPFNEIHSGPEVPYLVPRLMGLPGMKCIVSSRSIIDDRFTVYFMTYFADPPAPPSEGHQNWLRQHHSYLTPTGHRINHIRTDPWDFDVLGWMEAHPDSVGWIAPGDDTLTLHWSTDDFPYDGLPGRRHPLILRRGHIQGDQVPDGSPPDQND